jgi:predicted PurR-regulated permease PerM
MNEGRVTVLEGNSLGNSQIVERGFSWNGLTLFLLTLCVVTVCLLMLRPFLPAITGAAALAIVTLRPHNWIAARLRNRSLFSGR